MKEIYRFYLQIPLAGMLLRSLIVKPLATTGFIIGLVSFSTPTLAQNLKVDSREVTSYAQAVLAMEPARQQAFEEIKKVIGSKEVPKIVCNDPNSINALPSKARNIAVNYCNQSQQIVSSQGLSIDRFNQITIELTNNEALKKQVYNTLLMLQKNPPSR
ncbi:hypothetical protein B6N60_01788 [Richelia sinica FACHB-800]|uniref:DUF4168 domain-containing protein n=1 Tax=Richelia sinica FACHB-800 TaxID=1357546 RepID=A0A975Y4E7_9NOST|nr:DUF4168 domain-containing protein [Richelia sinica]MBD2666107.1 DUF4168 domain-containing protein [Richelia sinica FACHB-800]QXE23099.1 hypothetical protein B6N60_01788 [Richelia sinica FACHB-800]